ncbi:MAG: glycosyltransferase family 39 protein [Brasilonema angustatum HA4187-MV1]|jgi:4-amino-4-deoxy-L-arabinose transferase-like glycosyltransferase|nr:glycosyltransferase family 39 protein [Brasilonema angustatum HA4187-MV1]
MLTFILSHRRIFLYGSLAGLLLRLFFVIWFHTTNDDTVIYADIAKTWLTSGVYGTQEDDKLIPTYVRLPGYPAFLAAIFAIFGNDHYLPVLLIQTVVDLGCCLLVGAIALEIFGEGAAIGAFLVSVLCPFTANYCAIALSETLSIFFSALALWLAVKGTKALKQPKDWGAKWWAMCGLAIGAATFLRPDGVILLMAVCIFLLLKLAQFRHKKNIIFAGALTVAMVLAMLTPWTLRNLFVFHEFQPLAPRYANAPDEYAPTGFYQWAKTWMVDTASVEDIYWKVSADSLGEIVDLNDLPYSEFYNTAEREKTVALFSKLNQTRLLTPQLDAQFASLAQARIAKAPLRYYLYLPVLRIADMWLRPRTEYLDVDLHWWKFEDPVEDSFSVAYALLNFLLVLIAVLGMWKFRQFPCTGLLIAFIIIRSVLLGILRENPEPRFILECFPVILVFDGIMFYTFWQIYKQKSRNKRN